VHKKLLDALPFLSADPSACRWVCLQEDLLCAPNTIDAYARGVNDWLAFCHSVALTAAVAGRDTVALYVRSLHTGRQLAAATIRHRLTVVRLYNDWLCEEGIRERNPVRRGVWKNGGKGKAGIVPLQRRLPWIPDDAEWLRFLEVAGQADIRTRFMLALAYDCGLRREELCTVATGDIDPSQRLLTVRAEHTKNGTVAKLAMRQPFVLFKGLTFQKLCLPGAFRPGDHHNKMLRPGLCVVHASPQYL